MYKLIRVCNTIQYNKTNQTCKGIEHFVLNRILRAILNSASFLDFHWSLYVLKIALVNSPFIDFSTGKHIGSRWHLTSSVLETDCQPYLFFTACKYFFWGTSLVSLLSIFDDSSFYLCYCRTFVIGLHRMLRSRAYQLLEDPMEQVLQTWERKLKPWRFLYHKLWISAYRLS